jgi:hypothetical protein
MLSMLESLLRIGWACVEIGYSMAEHAQKLVTLGWAYAEIGYLLAEHTPKFVVIGIKPCFFPIHPFPCPLFPTLVYRPMSPVSSVCSLSPIFSSLSHVSVPCFPSTVPCLPSLFLVSHPLFLVSLICSLFPALCLPSSVPCLTSLFWRKKRVVKTSTCRGW